MEIVQALLLGIIEGLTEFLPISSTGHLIIAEDMLGYKDAAKVFTVVIQLGAIAAVIWYYRNDLWKRCKAFFGKKDGKKFWLHIFIASLPAVIVGFFLENAVTENAVTFVVAIALIAGGFVLLGAEAHFKKQLSDPGLKIDDITMKQALGIGIAQVVSLIPGVSRSGATIVGGMFAGLNRVTSAAFSFYLSIPIIIGASGYKLIKNKESLQYIDGGTGAVLVGMLAAFVSALFVVSRLLKYVAKHDFKIFAYYRIVLGLLLLLLIALGRL